MIALLDTSSLLAIVRYHLPFDTQGIILPLLRARYDAGEIIIIDEVWTEAKRTSKGLAFDTFESIFEPFLIKKTPDLIPNKQFFHFLSNDFCDKAIIRLKDIDEAAFDLEKQKFIASADCRLVLLPFLDTGNKYIVITEETESTNDGKIFKKVPVLCKSAGIQCSTVSQYLNGHFHLCSEVAPSANSSAP